ncbi:hypothetical protein KY285_009872 [Solanum tuberosum]|nr:hypothetical protein KY285_009872 [Solanum tuberosum]
MCGTFPPTPRTGRQIEDVEVRLQIQAYHFQQEWDQREQEFQRREQEYLRREREFQHREYESQRALAFATQELANAIACLGIPMSSKAMFAEPHVMTSKFLICEEVEKARGGAEPSAF